MVKKNKILFFEKQIKSKLSIFLSIALMIFVFLFFNQCKETNRLKNQSENTATFLNSKISYYQNELNQEVAKKESLKGDKQSLEVLLSKQIDSTNQLNELVNYFKKVDAAGNISQETRIDTILIPFEKAIDFEFVRGWKKTDKHFTVSGVTTNEYTRIDELIIPNMISFAIGVQSVSFWETKYEARVVNSNPYIKTIGIDTYSYSQNKKRWGVGPYIGFDIFNIEFSAGVSLNYNLIQF